MKSKFFYLFVLIAVMSACKKDVDELLWEEANSEATAEMNVNSVFEAMQDGPETFSVDASSQIEVLTSDEVLVRIPENAILDASGNLVDGEVDLEVLYVLTKPDMIRYRAPTMTNDGKFLESGGEIFVQAYKDGVALTFDSNKSYNIFVPTNDPDYDMDYFVGERDATGNVSWAVGNDSLGGNFGNPFTTEWEDFEGSWNFGYELVSDNFGWQNIDKFLIDLGEPASDNRITINLPPGYGNLNTAGYCILDDYQTVTSLLVDVAAEELYMEGIPPGTNVTIFIVSLQDVAGFEKSYAEVLSVVVEADHQITFTTLTERTAAEIESLLDAI